MFAYEGSTALITGASKGLGAAFARELARGGMNLVLVARSRDTLQDLAQSLGAQYGVRCVALQADLAAPDAVERIVGELDRLELKIDLLINNAGLGLTGDFLSHGLAEELADEGEACRVSFFIDEKTEVSGFQSIHENDVEKRNAGIYLSNHTILAGMKHARVQRNQEVIQ